MKLYKFPFATENEEKIVAKRGKNAIAIITKDSIIHTKQTKFSIKEISQLLNVMQNFNHYYTECKYE